MHTFLFRLQTFPGTLIIIDPHEYSIIFPGLLVGRGKKVKFRRIFRDKFAEKTTDFAGISREFEKVFNEVDTLIAFTQASCRNMKSYF